jgi:hypothetical protein
MTRCDVQASGAIELYFYDELEGAECARVETHLRGCAECADALEELRVIRDALAGRPDVSTPASGDWSGFMTRLGTAIDAEQNARRVMVFLPRPARRRFVAYLAMAAVLTLVTIGVTMALRSRHAQSTQTIATTAEGTVRPSPTGVGPGRPETTDNAAAEAQAADFAALSEEHFERSKLVVLGLATKDPEDRRASDWAYERELASSLLNDTRMYRLAAEDRGLANIADVMRDLELVLLETSLTDEKDPAALRQLQRVIQKRDLLEKMDAVVVPAADRAMRTKGI